MLINMIFLMKMIPCWFFDICFIAGLSLFVIGVDRLYGLSVAMMCSGVLLVVLTVIIYLSTRNNDS